MGAASEGSRRLLLVRSALLCRGRVHDSAKARHRQQFVGEASLHCGRDANLPVNSIQLYRIERKGGRATRAPRTSRHEHGLNVAISLMSPVNLERDTIT